MESDYWGWFLTNNPSKNKRKGLPYASNIPSPYPSSSHAIYSLQERKSSGLFLESYDPGKGWTSKGIILSKSCQRWEYQQGRTKVGGQNKRHGCTIHRERPGSFQEVKVRIVEIKIGKDLNFNRDVWTGQFFYINKVQRWGESALYKSLQTRQFRVNYWFLTFDFAWWRCHTLYFSPFPWVIFDIGMIIFILKAWLGYYFESLLLIQLIIYLSLSLQPYQYITV